MFWTSLKKTEALNKDLSWDASATSFFRQIWKHRLTEHLGFSKKIFFLHIRLLESHPSWLSLYLRQVQSPRSQDFRLETLLTFSFTRDKFRAPGTWIIDWPQSQPSESETNPESLIPWLYVSHPYGHVYLRQVQSPWFLDCRLATLSV